MYTDEFHSLANSDERYGIELHERMDMSLKVAIVEKSETLSYQKSIDEFKFTIYSYSTFRK